MIYTLSFTDKMLDFKLKIYDKLYNCLPLNLLSSTVTTNPAETLWQLQNDKISTSWFWSGFVTEFIGFATEQEL